MFTIALLAAAAHAPVMLAANDEAQWRRFVRASVQRPAAPVPPRLLQLQGVVRGLGNDRGGLGQANAPGPYGL
jgi:hypothetical protein